MSIQTDSHHYFWRGPFSNWERRHKLIVDPLMDNAMFCTSEAHFMMGKALFFNDLKVADLIAKENDPALVKKLGRQIVGFDPKAWECVREGVMNYACYLKFSQNEDLRAVLLETGNRVLVEASPLDPTWGIGIGEEDAAAGKPWAGLNLLGLSLMKVREMVR